jgi:sugar lactone lactonase YvrE
MKFKSKTFTVLVFLLCLAFVTNAATPKSESVFKLKPNDPEAYFFTPENYNFKADGKTDVTKTLQNAINDLKTKMSYGILFIPEGTYLISKTIYIPPSIRLIGYGTNRPVIVLGPNTPGFESSDLLTRGGMVNPMNVLKVNPMVMFTGNTVFEGQQPGDAGAGTFYSAISNIDFRIEKGNPGAICLRAHFAQHGYISHCNLDIGDGLVGIFAVGNEMEDVKFFGGEYGIYTSQTSPGWPMLMVDTYFEGQRKTAIHSWSVGLTIVSMQVKNVPVVVEIEKNQIDRLFMENCLFENVKTAGILIAVEDNSLNQINLRNIDCMNVPVLVKFSPSNTAKEVKENMYRVKDFTYGLVMSDLAAQSEYKSILNIEPLKVFPKSLAKDIPALPSMDLWVNIKDLGAKGDGKTDDTKVFQEAISKYKNIYLPQGWYRLTETVKLAPNTCLIGLHPFATQFVIDESTPAFSGFGAPKPMIESSEGGNDILSGIGISTGANNYRAVGCKWMAGAGSLMNDVKYVGGHGGLRRAQAQPSTEPAQPSTGPAQPSTRPAQSSTGSAQPSTRSAQSSTGSGQSSSRGGGRGAQMSTPGSPIAAQGKDLAWDTQYWSLWVTRNGGGTFKDIWTASTYATSGLFVSNTSTPSRIYAMSLEHHVRNEATFSNVSNWKVYAYQLEEESRESLECQPVELINCKDMTFANLWIFRVIRVNVPYPQGVRLWNCENINFLNVHNYAQVMHVTEYPVYDINKQIAVLPWEFAKLTVTGKEPRRVSISQEPGKVQKLASGFEFASGLTKDSKGNVYFCETRMRRIYRWSSESNNLSLIADFPWKPMTLACDTKDNLLVVFRYDPQPGYLIDGKQESVPTVPDDNPGFSGWGNTGWAAWAYSIDPQSPVETLKLLPKVPSADIKVVQKVIYPSSRWRRYDFDQDIVLMPGNSFVAPDKVTFIPEAYDLSRCAALSVAYPGQPFYMSDEYKKRIVKLNVAANGKLSDMQVFVQRGEFSSTVDKDGNVYVADGDIFVFDNNGKEKNVIKIEERPVSILLGGKDDNTLFITTNYSLFNVRVK